MPLFRFPRLFSGRPLVLAVAVAGLVAASYAAAQNAPAQPAAPAAAAPAAVDEAAVERGLLVFREGGCRACHGWSMNGVREGENIEGPSIRQTFLPPEIIRMTIQCGRPNAMMPYYDHRAYNLDERCYGISRFNVGDRVLPPRGRVGFTEQELDDLVAYLMAKVVGRPNEPTLAECREFFGPDNPNACRNYE